MGIQISQDTLHKFETSLESIRPLNAKDLIRREELGSELNFAVAENDFELAINLFKGLSAIDITRVPEEKIKDIINAMSSFLAQINSIRTFKASEGVDRRIELIDSFSRNYTSWFNIISPIVAYCTKAGTDYDALQRKAREALETFTNLQSTAAEEIKLNQQKIEETLAAVRKAAAEVGVTQHTTNFSDAATNFSKEKKLWMKVICTTLVIIIVYSFAAFWWCPIKLNEPYFYHFLQSALPRFTGLIALFYFLVIASRNYRAQAHNYIVNKNKQNALSTFETFVKASDNDEIKNAVLLQTTKAIFSNSPSGYLKNESDDDSPTQIIEIVKDVSKLAKP